MVPNDSDRPAVKRPGRPTRALLSEEMIARAALDLIDEKGWEACTMQRLASKLSVRAPSLYHHVENQQQVVDLVRTLVVNKIHDPHILELSWKDAMYTFGERYYKAFSEHPNTIQLLSTTPVRDRATFQMYECFLQTLSRAGWLPEQAFEALLGIEHLALGFAYEWNAEALMLESDDAAHHGATLLAETIRGRTNQSAIAEETFYSLLRRFIELFRVSSDDATGHGALEPGAPRHSRTPTPLPTEI